MVYRLPIYIFNSYINSIVEGCITEEIINP